MTNSSVMPYHIVIGEEHSVATDITNIGTSTVRGKFRIDGSQSVRVPLLAQFLNLRDVNVNTPGGP